MLQKKIRQSANSCIPIARPIPRKTITYWWNENLNTLRQKKCSLWKAVKRNPSKENIIEYKRANAIFKSEVKNSKRTAFVEFTKDINYNTPMKILWGKVNSLHSLYPPKFIHVVQDSDNNTLSLPTDIANHFAKTWSDHSKHINFPAEFVFRKSIYITPTSTSCTLNKQSLNSNLILAL